MYGGIKKKHVIPFPIYPCTKWNVFLILFHVQYSPPLRNQNSAGVQIMCSVYIYMDMDKSGAAVLGPGSKNHGTVFTPQNNDLCVTFLRVGMVASRRNDRKLLHSERGIGSYFIFPGPGQNPGNSTHRRTGFGAYTVTCREANTPIKRVRAARSGSPGIRK